MQDLIQSFKQHIEVPVGFASGVVGMIATWDLWEASFNAFIITIVTFFAKKAAEWLWRTLSKFFD